MKDWNITETIARKVLDTIDAGLSSGVGNPKPGEMCVEAAVCYALGLPHGDDPECVSRAVRSLKITLNDKQWSSNKARAKGLRRLGLAQLGSRGHIDDRDFSRRVATFAIRTCVPSALRHAASIHSDPSHQKRLRGMADKCEHKPTKVNLLEALKSATYAAAHAAYAADCASAYAAAYAVYAADCAYAGGRAAVYAAYAADAADYAADASADASASAKKSARDKSLADFAEGVVQILIEMKAPGCQWLALTEEPPK